MIREYRYVHSHRPYMVKLASFSVNASRRATVEAVWFRGPVKTPVAVLGELWDYRSAGFADVQDFLANVSTARHGGDALARWDGETLWAPQTAWEDALERRDLLKFALDNYPAVVPGYDGWWTFEDDRAKNREFWKTFKERNRST